eukprot:UN24846
MEMNERVMVLPQLVRHSMMVIIICLLNQIREMNILSLRQRC